MAYAKSKQFTSWSFSRLSDWRKCPRRAKYKHLDKLPEPKNDAMQRGTDIHKLAEDYVLGKKARLPAELKLLDAEFKSLKDQHKKKKLPVIVEDMWAFDAGWRECAWDDWNNCRVRIKTDVTHYRDETTVVITDWKTGKYREDSAAEYDEQLSLYLVGALIKFPQAKLITSRLGYIDIGMMYPDEDEATHATQKDLPKLIKQWDRAVKPMLADKSFKPKPSNECRWCPFSRAKGGPCDY